MGKKVSTTRATTTTTTSTTTTRRNTTSRKHQKKRPKTVKDILASIPIDDAISSSLLPKGFKPQGPSKNKPKSVFETIQQDDISSFLPPGFKPTTTTSTTE